MKGIRCYQKQASLCFELKQMIYMDSYPGDSRSRYLFPGFLDYWFAPCTRPHLQVPGVTGGRGSVFKAHSGGQPLKRRELKM